MQRWICVCLGVAAVVAAAVWSVPITPNAVPASAEAKSVSFSNPQGRTITVTPWGPNQAAIDAATSRTAAHPSVQRYLKGTRNSILGFEVVDEDSKISGRSLPPGRYRVIFYDYTNNRSVTATGSFGNSIVEASVSSFQPNPSPEEFQAALDVVSRDVDLGPLIRSGELQPYEAMPPVLTDGLRAERMVTVGLMHRNQLSNEVVGVNMVQGLVRRFKTGAPTTSNAAQLFCGHASAGQPSTPRGTAGQAEVVISRGGVEIWRFIVLRPAISSGNNASGIELRDVDYRGKRVLARANAPVLNVQYERNACGPFRDWSWQEGMFEADGTDIAPGIRMCTSRPETILESGHDVGNFRGVAIYDREDVMLVSELNAGWYRYPSMWIFRDDGVIEPRFGFGATLNSCVCQPHTHHVYWRFDFDIVTAANNAILETGIQSLPQEHLAETMRLRQLGTKQTWIVRNSTSSEACVITPGPRDGDVDKYGRGDVWLLRNHAPSEIDDSGTGQGGSGIHIGAFVNNEPLSNQDVVVWYGAHFGHKHFDDDGPSHSTGAYWVGPHLVLKNY